MTDFDVRSDESDLNEDGIELLEASAAGFTIPGLNIVNDAPKQFTKWSDESDLNEDDIELQEAFAAGFIIPGLNIVNDAPKQITNNVKGLRQKWEEFKYKLPWIEVLDVVNKQAPLAPELAAKMLDHEQKRENQLKNNKKLPQLDPANDPVINDFKREMMFHRQAQAAVTEAFPRLKALGLPTLRPDDYFAEMAKTDTHMQKIRENLMQKQKQQQQSERVKQLRTQRKEGKALQVQMKLQRQEEKKEMMDQVKKVRKGVSKDLSFLDGKKGGPTKLSRKALEKRRVKDKKFGFGGKKKGMKSNTKDSAADISEFKNPSKLGRSGAKKGGRKVQQRPGKNRRLKSKGKGKK